MHLVGNDIVFCATVNRTNRDHAGVNGLQFA